MGNRRHLCISATHILSWLNCQLYWLARRQSVPIRTRICFTWNCHSWRLEPLDSRELLDRTRGCTIDVSIRCCRNPYSRFARTWKFCSGKCWTNSLLRHFHSDSRLNSVGISFETPGDFKRINPAIQQPTEIYQLTFSKIWSLPTSNRKRGVTKRCHLKWLFALKETGVTSIWLEKRAESTRFELATPCGALHFQWSR